MENEKLFLKVRLDMQKLTNSPTMKTLKTKAD